jgi:dTDP-4-dehydrorhamnose reductase
MLGHVVLRRLSNEADFEIWGAQRAIASSMTIEPRLQERIITGFDAKDYDRVVQVIQSVRPDVVVNCIGVIKQKFQAQDPLETIPVNAVFPHRLAQICDLARARLVHISTDCVFSGRTGCYRETDEPDAVDLYGRSKQLGEITEEQNVVTLRTSIIGHELGTSHGLLEWFLSQTGSVSGYDRAIFSGVTTLELANILVEYVFGNEAIHGLFHVAGKAISKHDLLCLIAAVYDHQITIKSDSSTVIDRSLNAERFQSATGYAPADWRSLLENLRSWMRVDIH